MPAWNVELSPRDLRLGSLVTFCSDAASSSAPCDCAASA
jgi:hypothetical protein